MSSELPCLCMPQLPFWLSRWKEELLLFLLLAATFAIVSMAEVLHSHFLCPGRCSCISRIAPCPINCIRYRFSQSFSFTRSWVPCFFRDFLGSWGEMLLALGSIRQLAHFQGQLLDRSALWHNQIKSISCNYLGLHFSCRINIGPELWLGWAFFLCLGWQGLRIAAWEFFILGWSSINHWVKL